MERESRTKLTALIDSDLMEEVRTACCLLPPDVYGGTLGELVERGIRSQIQHLRRYHNNGEPFKRSFRARLRPGRKPGF